MKEVLKEIVDSYLYKDVMEENNIARCPHDIAVKIDGDTIPARTICNIKLIGIDGDYFVGK